MAQQEQNQSGVQEAQETEVWSLSPEDTLEEEMATPSSILAWIIPWTEEPGGLRKVHMVTKRWSWLSTDTAK